MRLVAFLGLLASGPAAADGWLVVEAPAAVVTSDAQMGVFRAGPAPAIGLYAENHRYALGFRLRAGVLRDGVLSADERVEPGTGGLATGTLALRVGKRGGWIEAAGGGGVTGRDFVPTFELGAGWMFALDRVDVGVSARHVQLVSRDPRDAFGTARLAVFGIDVRFGRHHRAPVRRAPPAMPEPVIAISRDLDAVIEREDICVRDATCPREPEVISQDIVVRDDRIILDERVLFDVNRAKVRSQGRAVLEQLAWAWRAHDDWHHITIEGHTDVRGTDEYNQGLSERRAERVRDVLVWLGCSRDAISVRGFGREKPRDTANDERAHERNRRVEFVIDRRAP